MGPSLRHPVRHNHVGEQSVTDDDELVIVNRMREG